MGTTGTGYVCNNTMDTIALSAGVYYSYVPSPKLTPSSPLCVATKGTGTR